VQNRRRLPYGVRAVGQHVIQQFVGVGERISPRHVGHYLEATGHDTFDALGQRIGFPAPSSPDNRSISASCGAKLLAELSNSPSYGRPPI